MDQGDPLDTGIMRCMEAVIHARRQPQCEEAAVAVLLHQLGIAQQVQQGIRRALDLEQLGAGDLAERADDAVAGARHNIGVGIEGAQARLQLPREAIVKALELGLFGLGQIEIREQPPTGDRKIPHDRVLDLAEPAHESGDGRPGNPVGQQEVNILLLGEGGDQAFDCHESVSRSG